MASVSLGPTEPLCRHCYLVPVRVMLRSGTNRWWYRTVAEARLVAGEVLPMDLRAVRGEEDGLAVRRPFTLAARAPLEGHTPDTERIQSLDRHRAGDRHRSIHCTAEAAMDDALPTPRS